MQERFDDEWRAKAACVREDPELFFPNGNSGPYFSQIEKAKRVCGRCAVAETCLRYALDTKQDSGIWGGLTDDERKALRRKMARTRRL
jgi:WhiB family redox-sensing transcriptional regulator